MQTGCCGPKGSSCGPSISSNRIASSRRRCAARCRPGSCIRSAFGQLTLDPALLDAGQISVLSARGIFPDGTPFAIPDMMDAPATACRSPRTWARDRCWSPCRWSLPAASASTRRMPSPSGARYRGRIVSVRDAVQGGSDPEEIEIARPQALLLAPGKSVGGYTALPVAEIKGVRADGGVALDETFLPPTLVTGAVSWYRPTASGSCHRPRPDRRGAWQDGHGRPWAQRRRPADAQSRQCGAPATGSHAGAGCLPSGRALTWSLPGLAGSMATYGSSARRLGELPAYDHMAPGPAYSALADALRSLILSLRYIEPKSRALPVMRHSTNVWKIRIDNPKLLVASRIVVRVGSELSEDALRKIFVNQATVGSARRVRGPVEIASARHSAETACIRSRAKSPMMAIGCASSSTRKASTGPRCSMHPASSSAFRACCQASRRSTAIR